MTSLSRYRALIAAVVLGSMFTASQAAPGPGDIPPPAIGHDMAGDAVLLTGYKGKAVIVTFWATWCPYCLKELPVLDRVQVRAGKEQIAVIAVNTESDDVFHRASRILRESMQLELANDANGEVQKAFGVHVLPHMVIIGRDGRILRVYNGYSKDSLPEIVADINAALRPLP